MAGNSAPGSGRDKKTGTLVIIENPRHQRSIDRVTTTDFVQWLMGKHHSPGRQQKATITMIDGTPHIHITRLKKA